MCGRKAQRTGGRERAGSRQGSGQGAGRERRGSRKQVRDSAWAPGTLPPLWDPHQGRAAEGGEDGPGGGWSGPQEQIEEMSKGPRRQEAGGHGLTTIRVQPSRTSPSGMASVLSTHHPGIPVTGRGPWMGTPGHKVRQALRLEIPWLENSHPRCVEGLRGGGPDLGGGEGCSQALGVESSPAREGRGKAACGQAHPNLCQDHPLNTAAVVPTPGWRPPRQGALGAMSLVGRWGVYLSQGVVKG